MKENNLSMAPPPNYSLSVQMTNGSSAVASYEQPIYQSEVPIAPFYTDPLPYPKTGPQIGMVNIGNIQPPPDYDPEADDIANIPTESERNNESTTTISQQSDNSERKKCIKKICVISLILVLTACVVAFFIALCPDCNWIDIDYD